MNPLRKWLRYCHGAGEDNQQDVYRCSDCGTLVTWKHIRIGDLCCSGRLVPTNPRWYEKARLLVLPWTY